MILRNIKNTVLRNVINIPGWRTNRKILVFESDDWGSIRMPSREVYESLLKKDIRVDNLSYNHYDSLASEEDLTALFEVLGSVKDKNGKLAILTANTIVANPDFEKIHESGYQKYYYEPFTEILKRYSNHSGSFSLMKEGISAGIFRPQFHGREHLNVQRWMRALRKDTGNVRLAFDYRMFDLSTSLKISDNSFMDALNYENTDEFEFQKQSIIEGLQLFEQLFGYKSQTFIAPHYIWSNELNKTLKDCGIKAFQGGRYQFEPLIGNKHKFKKHFHYTGQKNNLGQVYLIRNAEFEPSQKKDFDWNSEVMSQMEIAFRWHKPAIIQTHRINYIGTIDPTNRDRNLPMLAELLKKIVRKWPDVEFMSSDQLLNTIDRS
jgi:hypothetical protein